LTPLSLTPLPAIGPFSSCLTLWPPPQFRGLCDSTKGEFVFPLLQVFLFETLATDATRNSSLDISRASSPNLTVLLKNRQCLMALFPATRPFNSWLLPPQFRGICDSTKGEFVFLLHHVVLFETLARDATLHSNLGISQANSLNLNVLLKNSVVVQYAW
jgi:hypothetical protein